MEAEIIVGTYEDYVVGYGLESSSLDQLFAVRAHSGSVRSLACNASGSLAFSAGFDEMTNLFNLSKRKLLQTSEGAVNCARFVKNNHLICGSEDSNIYIHECRGPTSNLVKTLKGHKGPITSIDVHPSGKILLSVSKDNTMRTWNLIKGRCAYVTNIRLMAHIVKWSKSGEDFLLVVENEIYLYNNLGKLNKNIKLRKRINAVEFVSDNIIVVAIDSGTLEFFDIKSEECTPCKVLEAHETRVKAIKCLSTTSETQTNNKKLQEPTLKLVTASSDGVLKVWSLEVRENNVGELKEQATAELGARLTCMEATIR